MLDGSGGHSAPRWPQPGSADAPTACQQGRAVRSPAVGQAMCACWGPSDGRVWPLTLRERTQQADCWQRK